MKATYELLLLSAASGEVMSRQDLLPSEGLMFSHFLELGPDGSLYLLEEESNYTPLFHLVRINPDGTHPRQLPIDLPKWIRIHDMQFLPSGEIMILGKRTLNCDTLMAAVIDTTGRLLQLNLHAGMALTSPRACVTQEGLVYVTGDPCPGQTIPIVKLNAKGEVLWRSAEAGISPKHNMGITLRPLPNGHLLALGAAIIDTLTDGTTEGMFAELDAEGHLLRQERASFGRIYELAGLVPVSEGTWLVAYKKTSDSGYIGYLELVKF